MRHMKPLMMIRDVARAGSIRRAAEDMNLTSSALNRQIQAFEADFGEQIFERLPRGVRLNPAGELLMQHIQAQLSDLERVRSQVADLSGERRGHVSIACSQALNPIFLPREMARYRREHPRVTFDVRIRDRAQAEHDLSTFATDLAIVFEPVYLVDFEVIKAVEQPVSVVMAVDHPLAGEPVLRLRDCLARPHIVPSAQYGVRHLLDLATRGRSYRLDPVLVADSFELMRQYVVYEHALSFQIPIGLLPSADPRLVTRPLDPRDIASGLLLIGQMRGRTLPVATARFARQIADALT
ncbi:LysR family transcriptional regulator (plasmid) [Paroceanicella profunda]|uniref:LysR family transcriptional regulator n=1 Tax=Paroceanicella profunda TaxID=2579971 RepID=A0A5B8FZ88_9RHOB|nr:LysR substrate-binding domain-containing protein [Paroceanicella profunda]QDL94226.1 LysR family transcriptional regulator [Paroceanicella profunda]